jgi:hypothetical protein
MNKKIILAVLVLIIFIVFSTLCYPYWRFFYSSVLSTFLNTFIKQDRVLYDEINETNFWKCHVIDAHVKREHGASLSIGDMDNDGKTDVLIAFGYRWIPKGTDGVYWYKCPADPRNGNWERFRISDPQYPIRWSLATSVADMDNDGDLDVIALSRQKSNVYLMVNPLMEGGAIDKPWETLLVLNTPNEHRDGERIELVDINNDGFRDIIFPRGKPTEVHILLNPQGNIREKWAAHTIGNHGGADAHDVYARDMDNDGDLDIITATGDRTWSGNIYIFENPNTFPLLTEWKRYEISPQEANYGALDIDDIDGDGWLDIIATEAHGIPGKIQWFQNPHAMNNLWKMYTIDLQNYPHAGFCVDIDGDGQKEYWIPDASFYGVGRYSIATGGIVYYSKDDISLHKWTRHRVAYAPIVGRQARSADIDFDNDLDIISTADHDKRYGDLSIVWWENKLKYE